MHRRMTETGSVSFEGGEQKHRHFIACFAGIGLAIAFWLPPGEVAALPTVDEILEELHISAGDQEKLREGRIVDWSAGEGSERELALGMAFLVKTKPENIEEMYREALVLKEVSVITAHGKITGEGSMADMAGVKLQPNGDKEALRYLNVEPGDDLNLDAKEMAAFHALKSAAKEGEAPVKEVEALVRQTLLSRYQAYRNKGLSGIAPYDRGHGHLRNAGDELLLSTKGLSAVAKHLPAFHTFLLTYPNGLEKDAAKNLEEFFYWLNIDVFGRPTYVLVHRMLYRVGEAALAVERQYYASHDYNSMLQGIAALPTSDGTFLFYIGRVSTDQVGGFGSSMKHPVSRAITAPYLKDMFRQLQTKAGKR